MARIRSVHPELFTDEAFCSLSPNARLLLIGIWTLCDDHGIFEWKPFGMKITLAPVDNVNVDELLRDLVGADCIQPHGYQGKNYGAVRNFCRFQRPKRPTYKYPFPDTVRNYVAWIGDNAEPVPGDSPPKRGKRPHRRGEERSGEKGNNPETNIESLERVPPASNEAPPAPPSGSLSEAVNQVLKEVAPRPAGLASTIGTPLPDKWIPDDELYAKVTTDFGMTHADVEHELIGFHAHHAHEGSFSANWNASFVTWCKRWKEHKDKQAKPRVEVSNAKPRRPEEFTEAEWDQIAGFYARTGVWQRHAGASPGHSFCKCPRDILEKHNIDPVGGERRNPPRKVPGSRFPTNEEIAAEGPKEIAR